MKVQRASLLTEMKKRDESSGATKNDELVPPEFTGGRTQKKIINRKPIELC